MQYASRLYKLTQDNIIPVKPLHLSEGYASAKPLWKVNKLKVESASGASLLKIISKDQDRVFKIPSVEATELQVRVITIIYHSNVGVKGYRSG